MLWRKWWWRNISIANDDSDDDDNDNDDEDDDDDDDHDDHDDDDDDPDDHDDDVDDPGEDQNHFRRELLPQTSRLGVFALIYLKESITFEGKWVLFF